MSDYRQGLERAAEIVADHARQKEEDAPFEDNEDYRDRMLVYAKHLRRVERAILKELEI